MISLFIDTSLEDVSIALVKEGKELSQIHEYIPGKHSIYVTKYISDILKNNNLSPDNVDEIIKYYVKKYPKATSHITIIKYANNTKKFYKDIDGKLYKMF